MLAAGNAAEWLSSSSFLPLKEAAYEEIEEHHHKAGSGTAMKTIYVTAGFPSHPSAESALHHSDANSDTCTTVKEEDHQRNPTYSTVGHPTAPPEDASNGSTPLYYTVNKHGAKKASVNVH